MALELQSIDPPVLARACSGKAVVRARIEGTAVGACTRDPHSATGIVATTQVAGGGRWMIRSSAARP